MIGLYSVALVVAFTQLAPEWYWKFLNRLNWILSKPLGKCLKCASGQVALWWSLFEFGFSFDVILNASIAIAVGLVVDSVVG